MPIDRTQNLTDMKQKIIYFVKFRGPVLPIHISKETKTTLLLASAFLSDLVSEKTLKISNLKVGGSPVYFLPGQEAMLEKYHTFLPGKEKEAFFLLKEKKVLQDSEQEPAIRIALRNIKDFAIPYTIKFQEANFLFWQYFSTSEEEAKKIISEKLERYAPKIEEKPKEQEKPEKEESKKIEEKPKIEQKVEEQKPESKKAEEKKIEEIFETPIEEKPKPRKKREKIKPDRFLEEVKSFLNGKNIELIKVEKYDRKEVVAVIKDSGKESLLFAFDKKRVDEKDLLKAHKKSLALNLQYLILSKGEIPKKLKETLEAYKKLEKIEKLE